MAKVAFDNRSLLNKRDAAQQPAERPVTQIALGAKERTALLDAESHGWLTLTAGLDDDIVTHWHLKCYLARRPFAVLREEPGRASLWLYPTANGEFTDRELESFQRALADATGVVLARHCVLAFASPDSGSILMTRLLAATEKRKEA
jgi:hypothetical protein